MLGTVFLTTLVCAIFNGAKLNKSDFDTFA